MTNLAIDSLPGFTNHLGKARTARIRYAQRGKYPKTPGSRGIANPILEAMQEIEVGRGHPVEDILYGFAHSTDDGRPLGVTSLLTILQCMPVINSREISIMFAVSPRQARKYFLIVKIALPFIIRAINRRKALAETALQDSFTEHDLRAKVGSDLATDQMASDLLAHSSTQITRKHYRLRGQQVTPAKGFFNEELETHT